MINLKINTTSSLLLLILILSTNLSFIQAAQPKAENTITLTKSLQESKLFADERLSKLNLTIKKDNETWAIKGPLIRSKLTFITKGPSTDIRIKRTGFKIGFFHFFSPYSSQSISRYLMATKKEDMSAEKKSIKKLALYTMISPGLGNYYTNKNSFAMPSYPTVFLYSFISLGLDIYQLTNSNLSFNNASAPIYLLFTRIPTFLYLKNRLVFENGYYKTGYKVHF